MIAQTSRLHEHPAQKIKEISTRPEKISAKTSKRHNNPRTILNKPKSMIERPLLLLSTLRAVKVHEKKERLYTVLRGGGQALHGVGNGTI